MVFLLSVPHLEIRVLHHLLLSWRGCIWHFCNASILNFQILEFSDQVRSGILSHLSNEVIPFRISGIYGKYMEGDRAFMWSDYFNFSSSIPAHTIFVHGKCGGRLIDSNSVSKNVDLLWLIVTTSFDIAIIASIPKVFFSVSMRFKLISLTAIPQDNLYIISSKGLNWFARISQGSWLTRGMLAWLRSKCSFISKMRW